MEGSPLAFPDYKRFVKDSYLRNTKTFSSDQLPFTIGVFSDQFFDLWRNKSTVDDVWGRSAGLGGPLSFCYVDGNHTYPAAKRDFENCDAFLEAGGFIVFDDSAWDEFGVRQLMPEIAATGRYKLIATNPNHLFQKISN